MEFWGVEVKAGEPLKVKPDYGRLIHISQAALGEVKDVKVVKNVLLRLKIDDKSFIIGSLSAKDRTQLMFDFVFEKEFELSHDWKNGSMYFIGYIADNSFSDDECSTDSSDGSYSSDDSEDELVESLENGEIKVTAGDGNAAAAAATTAAAVTAAAAKAPKGAFKAATEKEESSDSDDDDEDSEDDSENDDSSEEELPNPKQLKKRPAESAQEAPGAAKKAKSSTPDKKGNKKGQNATPFPLKAAAGKTPPGDKSKQSPKSGGQFSRKSGNKSLNSKNAKGKRGGK